MPSSTIYLENGVSVKSLLISPKEELLPILQSLPGWGECGPEHVEVTQLSGAMTNLIYRCRNEVSGEYVLARVFGSTGALFEREKEQQIFAAVAHAGLGPKLLASFKNGRLEQFLLDTSVTAKQMRSKPIAICIAAAMALFNFTQLSKLPQSSRPKPICWSRLRSWAKELQGLYTPEELEALQISDLPNMIKNLEEQATALGPTWIGFCHNDTQYGNMLLHHASPETLEAKADAEDMLTTRDTFDEQPSGTLDYDNDGVAVKLGSSPPSFSYLMSRKSKGLSKISTSAAGVGETPQLHSSASHTTQENLETYLKEQDKDLFPINSGLDTRPDSLSKPDGWDGRESSLGGSPRTHPRGLSMFGSDLLKESGPSKADSIVGDSNLSIRLIDYEYAGYNPVALDIANHWCEYMADYHTDQPHQLHPDKFPNAKAQSMYCRAYIRAVIALKRQKEELGLPSRAGSLSHNLAASAAAAEYESLEEKCEQETIDHLAEKLRQAALAYVAVSHLNWGIWGLLQARVSDVPSFNFTSYAAQRLAEYRKWQCRT